MLFKYAYLRSQWILKSKSLIFHRDFIYLSKSHRNSLSKMCNLSIAHTVSCHSLRKHWLCLSPVPFSWQFWPAPDCLVPHHRKVCTAGKVLSDSNGRVKIKNYMPPTTYKCNTTWNLKELIETLHSLFWKYQQHTRLLDNVFRRY